MLIKGVSLTFLSIALFGAAAVPPAKVAPPPVCDPNHFLTKAYQDLLGRRLDSQSATYWLGMMKNGMSRTQVATQMIRSAEHANIRLRELYNTYLHRQPTSGELSFFSAALQQGTSEQVESSILASAEYFKERGANSNGGFIAALYQDLLGRTPDPQSVSMFTQQLSAGATRVAIAQQILSSPEARQRRISALYSRYLHRAAAGPPLPFGVDQVTATIIGSEEYCRQ